jgi:hypothetical protein
MSAALVTALIQAIPGLIQAGGAAFDFITKLRATLQQTGEWTPAMEAAFTQGLLDSFNLFAFLTDAERAALVAKAGTTTTTTTTVVTKQ